MNENTAVSPAGSEIDPDPATDDVVADDFARIAGPLRPELLAHCYRMLGSVSAAEDGVQETYLRAWRAFHRFDGRSSVRTWMYRIATNTCLNVLDSAAQRVLPTGLGQPAGDPQADLNARDDVAWLEPLPDRVLWQGAPCDPAARAVAREGIGLAFVAAVHLLPPRQRATLVLRDVLDFSAAQTAQMLDSSVASVNSALQRARATVGTAEDYQPPALGPQDERAVAEFVSAFERHDFSRITEVLCADLVWQMPPFDRWYAGPRAAIELSLRHCPATGAGDLRYLPAVCNGQPAVGMYLRGDDGAHHPFQFQVLTVRDGGIEAVTGFFGDEIFRTAGLPPVLAGRPRT